MPAVSQNAINEARVPILNHIRQVPQELHMAPNPGRNNESKFRRIDGEIDAIHETPTSLQASLGTRVIQRKFKRQRNSLVRLHQLPLEIVSNIPLARYSRSVGAKHTLLISPTSTNHLVGLLVMAEPGGKLLAILVHYRVLVQSEERLPLAPKIPM
ncbi:hypothetical protein FS837_011375 [Tulasnella sp. UAMH 9824]|nr:hypothetical protein FS837_011375 [Tulasnella sp. UAMH 9824]